VSRTRSFFFGALGALLVLVAAAIVVPQYSDYRARARGSEMLFYVRPVQDLVASRAIALQSLSGAGVGLRYETPASVKELIVREDGTLVVVGSHFGQVFVLMPSYSAGVVSWRCLGGSAKDVPATCGG
jgi:hypothetical protein